MEWRLSRKVVPVGAVFLWVSGILLTPTSDGGVYIIELQVVDDDGDTDSETEEIEVGHVLSEAIINHGPNPVPSEGCIFWFNLPNDTRNALLRIYDVDGRPLFEVSIEPNQRRYPTLGRWEPRGTNGDKLGSGLYVYRLKVEHGGSITWSDIHKLVIDR